METFFFISLGITFILILLLVYHFKQRLTVVEDKGDTMFEIMNNMVKEMGVIKTMAMRSMQYQGPFANIQQQMPPPSPSPALVQEPFREFQPTNEIIQSISEDDQEDDDEDEDEDEDSDEEDVNEESDEEDEDNGTLASEEIDMVLSEDMTQTFMDTELTENITKKIVVSEDETSSDPSEPLLVVDLSSSVELEEVTLEEVVDVPLEEVVEKNVTELSLDTVELVSQETPAPPSDVPVEAAASGDDYRKMTLGELKHAVVSKGLATDANKMKKRELLELLCVAK